MNIKCKSNQTKRKIKCVIWDLDNTIWNGVLMEDSKVDLKQGIKDIVITLDKRGILQSIVSKNDYNLAIQKLQELQLHQYFIYPKINWNRKSLSIKKIANEINIGMDTIAFIDDQRFELDEVSYEIPELMCIHANNIDSLLEMPEMNPRFITEDSMKRRLMYMNDYKRKLEEETFQGPQEDFLASLNMIFTIADAREEDLKRAEELTIRTHQLNTTGYTYSYEELHHYMHSDRHKVLITSLEDKYGSYGKIGLVLLECESNTWTIKLLLMSCRVMSRGVGSIMINYLILKAKEANVRLRAEFLHTNYNRMMYVSYRFLGFKENNEKDGIIILENDFSTLVDYPNYININISTSLS